MPSRGPPWAAGMTCAWATSCTDATSSGQEEGGEGAAPSTLAFKGKGRRFEKGHRCLKLMSHAPPPQRQPCLVVATT